MTERALFLVDLLAGGVGRKKLLGRAREVGLIGFRGLGGPPNVTNRCQENKRSAQCGNRSASQSLILLDKQIAVTFGETRDS